MLRKPQAVALLLLLASAALLCMHPVAANQLWHDVNRYDAHGNECKLHEKNDVVCSMVCVADINNCPSSLQPSCPDSQSFCADGQCHDQCTDEIQAQNPCHCKRSGKKLPAEAADLVPCMAIPNVTIYEFHPWNSKADIRNACGSEAGIADQSKTVGVWGSTWIGGDIDAVWAECPAAPAPNYRYNESYWLATFAVNGALAAFLALWSLYKFWAERGIRSISNMHARSTAERSSSLSTDDAAIMPKAISKEASSSDIAKGSPASEKAPALSIKTAGDQAGSLGQGITLCGYNNNIFGTFCVWAIVVVTVLWICYMGVWTGDYYGSLPGWRHGIPYSLAYESSFLELASFLFVWAITFIILIVLYIVKPHLRNYFRIRTLPSKGQLVCVIRPVHNIKLLEDKVNWIQHRINQLTDRLTVMLCRDMDYTTCPVNVTSGNLTYFTYQCTRYIFDKSTEQFAPFEFDIGTNHRSLVAQARGLSSEEAFSRQELVGPNFIEVKVLNVFMAFAREFFGFFYIYQFIFLWAFYFYEYYQVGLVDTGIILLSATIKVALRMQSERRLKRMAEQEEEVLVLRDSKWTKMTTRHLVAGDVVEVTSGAHMSCDCILLSGNAIMNESSLTGEPLPIRKFPLHIDDGDYDAMGSGKISTLYAGTIVSQVQPVAKSSDSLESDRVLALVWHTGTMSEKGQLVRKILFPNPITFIFNEQMRIVIFILVLYAGFVMGMAAYLYQGNSTAIVFFGVFALSQLCSPILPAAMVIGQSVAAVRLRKKQVYCVDPQRIMIAGKVQMFCFDKTGTLTKEGLEFYGGQGVDPSTGKFKPFETDLPSTDTLFQQAVASCHAVTELNGQLIGNPVDIEQFRASKAAIDPAPEYLDAVTPPEGSSFGKLHVVRRFEFVHARASMSVTVLDEATSTLHVFVKGSFERIKSLSRSESVPGNYDEACANLAREGCYVLAFAHKTIDATDPTQIKGLTQDELETGCDLLGLLVFKNMLKDDTAQAIAELKGGSTRTVMITGDTALTGIYIARQCGMLPADNRVLLGECKTQMDEIQWIDVDTMEPVSDIRPHLAELGPDGFSTTELAVNGAAFERLCLTGEIDSLIFNIRVFARMKPAHKVECIEQHMKYGVTAMCGDGGNDCGALRAAHVGIALSDAEASIVSPFSSSDRSIMSCVQLLIESRAGLATSFANFAALICYGQVMSGMVKMASFYFAISLTQNLWMLIDGAVATGMMLTISLSGPARRLAPSRPTSRILGPQMLASVGGTVFINWVFGALVYVWLFQQDWFRCNEHATAEVDPNMWWLLGDNFEASVLSFVSAFQFVNNGFLVNYGYRFRAAWYKNYALLVVWAFLISFVSYILLADPNRVGCAFRLNCGTASVLEKEFGTKVTWSIEPYNSLLGHNVIPRASRYALWGYCIGNMAASNIWQLFFINGPVRRLLSKKKPLHRLKVKL
ncbi:hypothetical protein EV178_002545 [Coemansia sp. RSA 1646]|nr:hypothetical protein EV178_002545 [Coemansia sp. RSA 1646]KAJ2091155.1 hypothetical protein IW138_002118 [Coemansia sp. RSA 986]